MRDREEEEEEEEVGVAEGVVEDPSNLVEISGATAEYLNAARSWKGDKLGSEDEDLVRRGQS